MRRLALILLLCACGHGLGEQPCAADRDCPSPQTCVSGRCASAGFCIGSAACNSDAACGSGQHCANGCCQPGESGSCARDADCSSHPATPVCDTAKGACVACLTARDCGAGKLCQNETCVALPGCARNADCAAPTPVCDTQQHACVQCLTSNDCRDLAAPNCNASHTCVAVETCTTDADCQKPVPRCLVSAGNCVACLTSADCVSPLQCDPVQNVCLTPSATTCTSESDCASNAADPHCLPGQNGKPGVCVECLNDGQCQAGQHCSTSNTCVLTTCTGDSDCQAPTPRCNLADTPNLCVACLGNADCPNGGTCQADHTCAAAAGCQSDKDCAQNVADPHCNTTSGACVQCLVPADCGTGKTCTPQDTCVASACKSDNDCASLPQTPHCDTVSGACVQCTASTQCAQGYTCTSDACAPVCTVATQGTDCPAATPKCRVSPFPECVQCVSSSDCGPGQTCSTSNVCVAQTGCTSNAQCPATTPVCVAPNCVQCAADTDCKNGEGCDTSAHTCTLTGGNGQICSPGNVCNTGLLCIDEGGAFGPVCLPLCNPYASACASGSVCEWFGFDGSGAFEGFCAPPNGNGQLGASCNPNAVDSCEWNLICAPVSGSAGVCSSMCDPTLTGNCGSNACNGVVGAVSAAGTQEKFGYCGPASKWGASCQTDTPASTNLAASCGSAVTGGPYSSSTLFCTPSYLIAEDPQASVLGLCTFTPGVSTATGGADDSCAADTDLDCRTGICLTDGPVTCFSGCTASADCNRDCLATDGVGCSSSVYCVDLDFATAEKDNIIAACEPVCRDDADCIAQTAVCVPSPIHGAFSWRSFCSPQTGSGPAGSQCTGGSDCGSGICVTAATLQAVELQQTLSGFNASDGFCLGAAYPTANPPDCNTAGIGVSINAALPLAPADGVDGVMGRPNPGVCWPLSCSKDSNCAGLSADPATPRVCAPYKTTSSASIESTSCTSNCKCCPSDTTCATTGVCGGGAVCDTPTNNPNPGNAYGTTGGIFGPNGYCRQVTWALECAPSLGAAKGGPGAACTHSTDCATGHCLVPGGYCFGGCSSNSDCQNGTTCKGSGYLGMSASFCQP